MSDDLDLDLDAIESEIGKRVLWGDARGLGDFVQLLAAEVRRLRRWKDEAAPVLMGLQDLGKALGLPLGESITGEVAAREAERLRGRNDRCRAQHAPEIRKSATLTRAADLIKAERKLFKITWLSPDHGHGYVDGMGRAEEIVRSLIEAGEGNG